MRSRPHLATLLPALAEVRWLAWELGLPEPDGSVPVPRGESHVLRACKSVLWLLSLWDTASHQPMFAVHLAQVASAPAAAAPPTQLQ